MAPRQRPAPVTAIAYLNIIFGGLWTVGLLCCGGCMGLTLPALQSQEFMNDPDLRNQKLLYDTVINAYIDNIPFFVEWLIARYVFWLAMSLLLLVAGIGLLRLAPWARKACIFYGLLTILVELGMLGYTLVLWNPGADGFLQEIQEFKEENPDLGKQLPGASGASNPVVNAVFAVLGTSLLLLYPLIVLIIMSLPKVKAAFRGAPATTGPPPGATGMSDAEFFGYERPPEDRGP
jgi:hypothetical protein